MKPVDSDSWGTPKYIIDYVTKSYGDLVFDAACTADNCIVQGQTLHYPDMDLLTIPWNLPGWIWCNPPYSNVGPFIDKAIESLEIYGQLSVFLVRADLSTKWMNKALDTGASIEFITHRIKFNGADNCYNFPSCFLAFDGNSFFDRSSLSR